MDGEGGGDQVGVGQVSLRDRAGAPGVERLLGDVEHPAGHRHRHPYGGVGGGDVEHGAVGRNKERRLLRDNVLVHTGKIESLKRFKNDASEVKSGCECGISLANYNDLKPGDVIEAFVTERVAAEAIA